MFKLTKLCSKCLGCNRLELDEFEGVYRCEYYREGQQVKFKGAVIHLQDGHMFEFGVKIDYRTQKLYDKIYLLVSTSQTEQESYYVVEKEGILKKEKL